MGAWSPASLMRPLSMLLMAMLAIVIISTEAGDDCMLCGSECPAACFQAYIYQYDADGSQGANFVHENVYRFMDAGHASPCWAWRRGLRGTGTYNADGTEIMGQKDSAKNQAGRRVIERAKKLHFAGSCGGSCMITAYDELKGEGDPLTNCAGPAQPPQEANLLQKPEVNSVAAKTDDLLALVQESARVKDVTNAGWTCW